MLSLKNLMAKFAYASSDSPEIGRQKRAIFVVAGSCCLAGSVWTAMYLALFGWGLVAALPAAFVFIVGGALLLAHFTRDHRYAVYAQIFCITQITTFIQWSIGGVLDSGFVMAWALVGPVCALMFLPLRRSIPCFVLYLLDVGITIAFDDWFTRHGVMVGYGTRKLFIAMNLSTSATVIFTFAAYFVHSASSERVRADALQNKLDEEEAKKLGPYTLESKLGEGGMGVVYLARHALLRRTTAIKLLNAKDASRDQLQRFEREVQLTSELNHPNVVAVYDYGHSPEGEFYYAMEHLPGTDLESLVETVGPLPVERVVPILVQIADALDAAHHRGLVHRDIKPANIILSRFGKRTDVVKVLDFGLVKDIRAPQAAVSDDGGPREEMQKNARLSVTGMICGTPAYMPPEAVTSEAGPAGDLYSLGGVAFFLLVGDTIFHAESAFDMCMQHQKTPPPAPSTRTKVAIPSALDQLILRCLAKRPEDRPKSAAELRDALSRIDGVGTWSGSETWWDEFERHQKPKADQGPLASRAPTMLAAR